MELIDTAAVVTGGASGLGAATARELASRGAHVYALDLPQALESAAGEPGVSHVPADVTDEEQVERAVAAAISGGRPLRTVVNCAGIAPSARILARSGRHNSALFAKVLQVNLVGTFTVMAVAAEAMARNAPDDTGQRGVVVNTGSIAGYEGQIGQAAYAASKGGVIGLTLAAARDLAQHGIRVCTVAPGIVDTPMLATVGEEYRQKLAESVPFPQRLCTPREYAQLVAMVIDHDYINGETIRMDGALRMAPR